MQVKGLTLDTRKLDKIAAHLGTNREGALKSLAHQVEAGAKVRAPVDTGALKNGIHVERKSDDLFWVADSVEYGIYQELGTHKMAAQPFMVPAVEMVQRYLADDFKVLFK